MPAKGQGCVTCAGDCCNHVGYFLTSLDETDEAIWGQVKANIMGISTKELRLLGAEELWQEEPHGDCESHINGRCAKHGDDKPRLCKSYYCHGKHWRLIDALGE